MDVPGAVVLVTGAGRRVGRAIALAMAQAGCDVAVHCHRSTKDAATVADQIRVMGRRAVVEIADLGEPDGPMRLVEQTVMDLGRLDILVNNASVFVKMPLDQADVAAWERILRVNTIAPALLARAAVPHMRRSGAGRIVNLIDILADRPIEAHGLYCASKAALAALTRSLALELAPEITVNGISPGIAVFPDDFDEALRQRLIDKVPLKRAGSPEQIAAVVRFLATEGDYITGQIIAVDGGMSL
ncbi:MAG TPA: SDR family oxidoreductase [Phycisphaerae bacterium]|nr:SDR family oxidoreductase [Phycisphaerae bacterium]